MKNSSTFQSVHNVHEIKVDNTEGLKLLFKTIEKLYGPPLPWFGMM